MILKTLYAMVATMGFGILFNIRGKNLLFASLGGGLGWLIYIICLDMKFTTTTSMFLASFALGLYSEIMARIRKAPVTVFVVSALIPLVPGGGMYYTMLESIKGNINMSLQLGLETITNAGALAIGILLSASIFKLIVRNKRQA